MDRRKLAYLNSIEKFNCVYCEYVNGLIAYVQEIAGRTEQYWCPIKHAMRVKSMHSRYRHFLDYGRSGLPGHGCDHVVGAQSHCCAVSP